MVAHVLLSSCLVQSAFCSLQLLSSICVIAQGSEMKDTLQKEKMTMATEPRIIKFYETTLRDGEQTPGVNYFPEEKLAIAQALADMGFDTLDCGFPISSPGEFEAVRMIASKVENAEICSIARTHYADIDRALEAVMIENRSAIQPFHGVYA